MRSPATIVLLVVIGMPAASSGQSSLPDEAARKQWRAQSSQAIRLLHWPLPTNGPLRYQNISDLEVQEVQRSVATIAKGYFVNIGSVIEGCACEEGPLCTAQLAVVVDRRPQSLGLALTQQDGHWQISRVQSWALRYQAFQAKYGNARFTPDNDGRAAQRAYVDSQQALYAEMPRCETPATRPPGS